MRRARELAELDLTAGALAVGVRRRELRAVERGRREIDPSLVERAVDAYGGDDLHLPPRRDLVGPSDPEHLVVGEERIRIDPGRADDVGLLVGYVAAVRRQRGLGPEEAVPFRSHDLVQLAAVLDLSREDLEGRLSEIAGLGGAPARRSVRMLVLTGLSLALQGLRPERTGTGDSSWLARDAGPSAPRRIGADRLGEIEDLMAELRSAT